MSITTIERPSWLREDFYPFVNYSIDILGHQIHFIDEGQGPTVFLLHGNGSWTYGFRFAITLLSKHFRVVALDLPGFGLSVASKNFSYKPRDHSAVVEAFIDTLKLKDIRICVEDWGGPIGMGFAGRRPELIHSIIITNTWAWPAQGSPGLERFSKLAGSWLGYYIITRFNVLTRFAVPSIVGRKMSPEEAQGYWKPYQTVASRYGQAIFPHEILASREYLSEVEKGLERLKDKPVQIIWGEQDAGFNAVERERWEAIFPRADVLILPDAHHFVLLDEPEKSVEKIISFQSL